MTDITPKEAIANLNHIYGIVAPDIQRSIDVAIKALEDKPQGNWNYIQAGMAVCPFCGGSRRDNRVNHINFCNRCGAKMGGEKNDTGRPT